MMSAHRSKQVENPKSFLDFEAPATGPIPAALKKEQTK